MTHRAFHLLVKGGTGMNVESACGRSVYNMPLGLEWEEFKAANPEICCQRCLASKYAKFYAKQDAKNREAEIDNLDFEPDDWEAQDRAAGLIR